MNLISTYTYAGMTYANPHAATQIANGLSTSTFAYDNNGNLAQKTTNGITTTHLWDYANRLIALGVNNATTTYGYWSARNEVEYDLPNEGRVLASSLLGLSNERQFELCLSFIKKQRGGPA